MENINLGCVPINGDFHRKSIVSFAQFDPQSLGRLFEIVPSMREIAWRAEPVNILAGKIVYLLFYEPSSRTRGSFDGAVKQLGGNTIVEVNPQQYSSVAKGESFQDTIRTDEAYCDLIVLRHPETGSALTASRIAKFVPIVNAGDGIGEHPTQALLDLYTIQERSRTLSGLKGLVAGDLLNGRTVHSLLQGLDFYPDNTVYLLAPRQLQLPEDFKYSRLKLVRIESVNDIPRDCNFWYWTRVQKERFAHPGDYEAVNNRFVVTRKLLNERGNEDMILMHPLPRVGEIEEAVDDDRRAVYLTTQIRNGMYVRMALLAFILGKL